MTWIRKILFHPETITLQSVGVELTECFPECASVTRENIYGVFPHFHFAALVEDVKNREIYF